MVWDNGDMIAHVSGVVAVKNLASVVVDVGGIGYEIQISRGDFNKTTIGEKITFQTYHHVREQSQELFGFIEPDAKQLFEQLLSVKNVGPKVALAVLDTGPSSAVRAAIASGEVKFLQSAKGVGKRAAEQMVVELRDKVGLMVGSSAEDLVGRSAVDQQDEALQALVALGYLETDAQLALQNVDKTLPTEERIKQALKKP
jgi:Holliday junction DNA helicase RuvA